MNEEMKAAWLEISQMLGEPTREELDVFMRTWQRASQATREALAEQPAQQEQLREENERLHVENRRLIDRIETIGVPVGVGGFATTTTAQRTWVGLTNDEVNEFAAGCHLGNSVQGAIYKAEAKLKEKNT